jgi:U3 small nucleolar RNA-associated protein 20
LLLNGLSSAGYLTGGLLNVQGGRWRQSLVGALQGQLESMASKQQLLDDDRRILAQLLRLIPALPADAIAFAPSLVTLLEKISPDAKGKSAELAIGEWQETGVWNDAHLLASLLRCTSDLVICGPEVESTSSSCLVKQGLLKRILGVYHWNGEIMNQVSFFVERWKDLLRYVIR